MTRGGDGARPGAEPVGRERDPLAELDANYLDANRIYMGCSDTGEYVERRDVAIVSCGLPVPELNWGFLKPGCADVPATAAAVRAHFAARKLPFQVTFRGTRESAWGAQLAAAGWTRRSDANPGMSLALEEAPPAPKEVPPAPPPGLEIEEVRTPAQLVAYREAAFRGFGYPVAAAPLFLNERLLGLPLVRLYAGRVEGAVVATSMLVATGAVAGIYWVATLEAARGRGHGAALTWAAAAGGRALGCRVASLQASKLGFPVYARMGFAHVLDYERWLPPEA